MPPGDWIAGGFNDLLPETHQRITPLRQPSFQRDPAPQPTWTRRPTPNTRAFVNYYIHQVNLLRYLLGESYRVSYADPAKVLLIAHSESGVPCTHGDGSVQHERLIGRKPRWQALNAAT